jgi:hypothetical protein
LWIDEKQAHKFISMQCLDVMKRDLKKDICDLHSVGIQRSEINTQSIHHHLPPELRYACRYWAQHLTRCQDPINELPKAVSFLKIHLLHWLEAMGILGLISEVVGMIKQLQYALQVSTP